MVPTDARHSLPRSGTADPLIFGESYDRMLESRCRSEFRWLEGGPSIGYDSDLTLDEPGWCTLRGEIISQNSTTRPRRLL
jgi:hypothetical protein